MASGSKLTATATSPADAGWFGLLRASVIVLVVDAIALMLLLIRGFDPVSSVIAVLFIIGLVLTARGGRAGPIMMLVVGVLFFGFGAPFFVLALTDPTSAVEFVINLVFLVAGVVLLISSIALVRKAEPSGAPRTIAVAAVAVVVAGAAVAVVARATVDQPVARAGDLTMTASDTTFSKTRLAAPDGNVTIVIDNQDLGSHTFTIDDLDVDESLAGGLKTEVSFDAPSGTYAYYCAIQGHRPTMHGTLTIP